MNLIPPQVIASTTADGRGQCARLPRIERRTMAYGREQYRVAGVVMPWCSSSAEACRVADILDRCPVKLRWPVRQPAVVRLPVSLALLLAVAILVKRLGTALPAQVRLIRVRLPTGAFSPEHAGLAPG